MDLINTTISALGLGGGGLGLHEQHARMLALLTPLGRDKLIAERVRIVEDVAPGTDGQAPAGFRIELQVV